MKAWKPRKRKVTERSTWRQGGQVAPGAGAGTGTSGLPGQSPEVVPRVDAGCSTTGGRKIRNASVAFLSLFGPRTFALPAAPPSLLAQAGGAEWSAARPLAGPVSLGFESPGQSKLRRPPTVPGPPLSNLS